MSKEEAISLLEEVMSVERDKTNKVLLKRVLRTVKDVYANLEQCKLDELFWSLSFFISGYTRYPESEKKEKLSMVHGMVLRDVVEGLVSKCGCKRR
jgi:hypothetical protein